MAKVVYRNKHAFLFIERLSDTDRNGVWSQHLLPMLDALTGKTAPWNHETTHFKILVERGAITLRHRTSTGEEVAGFSHADHETVIRMMGDPPELTTASIIARKAAEKDKRSGFPAGATALSTENSLVAPTYELTVDGKIRQQGVERGRLMGALDATTKDLRASPESRLKAQATLRSLLGGNASLQFDTDHLRHPDAPRSSFGTISDAAAALGVLCRQPYRLGKVSESSYHKAREKLHSGECLIPTAENLYVSNEARREVETLLDKEPRIFLIQHDWAAAFAKAQDYEGGEFRLPYDLCVFETRVNGFRVLLDFTALEGQPPGTVLPLVQLADGNWFAPMLFDWLSDGRVKPAAVLTGADTGLQALMDYLAGQVRAICIALDAEVAETEIVRAPHKLNHAREKAGKLPLYDFHIVTLGNRRRARPLEDEGHEPGTRRRLHFVRGHWRHYESRKTWIKWHYRGDPDLGWIEKEYRL